MKKLSLFFVLISLISFSFAQEEIRPTCRQHQSMLSRVVPTPEQMERMESMAFRSDTFDITHYAIHLDEVNYGARTLKGFCDVFFSPKMEGLKAIHLDLLNLQVDSVFYEGKPVNYTYDSLMIHTFFDDVLDVNDTTVLRVYYGGRPTIDASGFGGFDFRDGYSYNLGIGLAAIPHNYGRGWFPCFDNFVERSTFEFFINTENSKFAYAVGTHISTDSIDANHRIFHYHMKQPITTYQAAVAIADYGVVRYFHEGIEKEIPVELVSKKQDTTKIKNSLVYMTEAIEALEQWYGPYQWERVGYVLTPVGAMEHPTCVSYPTSLGLNENPYNNLDIMSHELAHHWFGNLTTLTTAYDMWIKEGTSEYGYHLFTKEFLGDEEFYDLIASNQYDVIEHAHRDDDGFRALSGMPFEYTYGTTTYQKGAAVIHNMQSYLGDSLFKTGVRAILDKYAFSHCDAAEFEATLTEATGKDMSAFFQDWIYAPGFSAFEIDSVKVTPNGNQFDVSLSIEQKLYAAPHYHTQVPMEVTFYDANWQQHPVIVELNGQYSEVTVRLDFEPVFQMLNRHNFLNNGQLSYSEIITEGGTIKYNRSKLDVIVPELSDSILLYNAHIYGPPDPIKREDLDIQMSDKHYWIIDGVNPNHVRLKTSMYYEGNQEALLDYDLVHDGEENVILLYRKNASEDWVEYPYAVKNAFIPNDGKGFFRIDSVLFGQYTFGVGDYFEVNTKESKSEQISFVVQPNPADHYVTVQIEMPGEAYALQVYNTLGQLVESKAVTNPEIRLDIQDWLPGTYFIRVLNERKEVMGSVPLIRQ